MTAEQFTEIIFIVIWICSSFGIGMWVRHSMVSDRLKELQHYKETYLWKVGGTLLVPNAKSYKLFSPDGGLNWYAVDADQRGSWVKIIGAAEEVYPGLIGKLRGMHQLVEHVKKKGPLALDTTNSTDATRNRKLLEAAGFTVTPADEKST